MWYLLIILMVVVAVGIKYNDIKRVVIRFLVQKLLFTSEAYETMDSHNPVSEATLFTRNVLRVDYQHQGEIYTTYIPYNRRAKSNNKYLLDDQDLNHNPKTPFTFTANQMGGERISVVDEQAPSIEFYYENQEIP